MGVCPHAHARVSVGRWGTAGSGSDSDGEARIGILGAGSDSGGPHGPGAVGIGLAGAGSDSEGWTLHRGISGASPATLRDLTVEVEAWSHLRVEEVCFDGWVRKKQKLPYVHTPTRSAPLQGGTLDRVGPPALQDPPVTVRAAAGPSRPGAPTRTAAAPRGRSKRPGSRRPFKTRQVRPGLSLASRSVHSGVLNPRCTVRGKGDGLVSPLCLTNTADSHLGVHVHVMSA